MKALYKHRKSGDIFSDLEIRGANKWRGRILRKLGPRQRPLPTTCRGRLCGDLRFATKGCVHMRYAGLTDEPERRKREASSPRDFRVMQQFTSETAARRWKMRMTGQGYSEDTSGKG